MTGKHYVESRALGIRESVGDNERILNRACPIDGALLVNYIDSVEVTHDNYCKICNTEYPDLSEEGLQDTAAKYIESLRQRLADLDKERSRLTNIIINAAERGF